MTYKINSKNKMTEDNNYNLNTNRPITRSSIGYLYKRRAHSIVMYQFNVFKGVS